MGMGFAVSQGLLEHQKLKAVPGDSKHFKSSPMTLKASATVSDVDVGREQHGRLSTQQPAYIQARGGGEASQLEALYCTAARSPRLPFARVHATNVSLNEE